MKPTTDATPESERIEKTIDVDRPMEAYNITCRTMIDPVLVRDQHDPSFVKFRYPDCPAVRTAIEAYLLNKPVPIRDFERVFLRLRHLMYQTRQPRVGR